MWQLGQQQRTLAARKGPQVTATQCQCRDLNLQLYFSLTRFIFLGGIWIHLLIPVYAAVCRCSCRCRVQKEPTLLLMGGPRLRMRPGREQKERAQVGAFSHLQSLRGNAMVKTQVAWQAKWVSLFVSFSCESLRTLWQQAAEYLSRSVSQLKCILMSLMAAALELHG